MGCIGCDARVRTGYGQWMNPYVLAGFIVTVIMLAALLLSSLARMFLHKRQSVPVSRLLTLFAAVFFTIVTFTLSIARTAVYETQFFIRGRFLIINVFILAFQLISLTLIRAHVGHLLEASLVNTSYKRAVALFNILTIVLLAALVCVEIGLYAYALTFEIEAAAGAFTSGSVEWTYAFFCVDLTYDALYLFSLILTAPVLFVGLFREKTRKASVFFTMLALFLLVIVLALTLAFDALYVKLFAATIDDYGRLRSYLVDDFTIDAAYYQAIAPILATFFQALVLITLMFIPSAESYDHGLSPESPYDHGLSPESSYDHGQK